MAKQPIFLKLRSFYVLTSQAPLVVEPSGSLGAVTKAGAVTKNGAVRKGGRLHDKPAYEPAFANDDLNTSKATASLAILTSGSAEYRLN